MVAVQFPPQHVSISSMSGLKDVISLFTSIVSSLGLGETGVGLTADSQNSSLSFADTHAGGRGGISGFLLRDGPRHRWPCDSGGVSGSTAGFAWEITEDVFEDLSAP